ncbi:unnamed protein product, partial [Discosporangium mesarthrocarpum]
RDKVLSSLHEAKRSDQRGIGKHDHQTAVKYGKRTSDGEWERWKYTFKNIVYITDESSTPEVTSWG